MLVPWRLVQLVSQVSFFSVCKFEIFHAYLPCYFDPVATFTTSFSSHKCVVDVGIGVEIPICVVIFCS